jgi:hypothetical protein
MMPYVTPQLQTADARARNYLPPTHARLRPAGARSNLTAAGRPRVSLEFKKTRP